MRRWALLTVVLGCAASAQAHGLLIPVDRNVPPLALKQQNVKITIQDQVALTRLEQTFHNHTERDLEATYVFPVPKGASVNKFTLNINGKDIKAELVEAERAREVYTSAVQQSKDPGLLDYLGADLFRVRVVAKANEDQKLSISYDSVARREGGLVEYIYPIKANGKTAPTIDNFGMEVKIESQHGVENVYSPSHAITLKRRSDKEVDVVFTQKDAIAARDFTLYYQLGEKDVGLTALTHRPVAADDGHFMMLISPQLKLAKDQQVPRDIVLVMDTSGSMQGVKIAQARNALKHCLGALTPTDRFAVLSFATSVNRYKEKLVAASADEIARAKKWVDELEATGGTAINDALQSALELREKDEGRAFNIAFFTDGMPTVGETNHEKILKNAIEKNTASTRIFTFGVGDDVNATLLDELANRTRAWATYVRPAEDIEAKVSGMYTKISHPVLTNLKIEVTGEIRLKEMYPPQIPDLFHGGQLSVTGRYTGRGPSAIKLTGMIGKEKKEFVYELTFPERTGDNKEFVEHLWARRKVGYLLNEIRANGAKKELTDEVTTLAKRYGIVTPYTSYLLVPDGDRPVSEPRAKPAVPAKLPDVRFGASREGGGKRVGSGSGNQPGKPANDSNIATNTGAPIQWKTSQFAPGYYGGLGGQFGGQFGVGGFGGQFGLGGGGFQGGGVATPGQLHLLTGGGGGGGSGRPGTPGGSTHTRPTVANLGPLPPGGGFGQFGLQGGGFGGQFGVGGGAFPGGPAYAPNPAFTGEGIVGDQVKTDPKKSGEAKPTDPDTSLEFARSLRQAGVDGRNLVPYAEETTSGKDDKQDDATRRLEVHLKARRALLEGKQADVQSGQLGVDLSVEVEKLRQQSRLGLTNEKKAAGRDMQLIAGLWIDKEFKEKTDALVIKAQSKAYFRLLEKHPELKDVFRLGNNVVWIAPSGTALVLDTNDGKDELKDDEIEKLFVAKK